MTSSPWYQGHLGPPPAFGALYIIVERAKKSVRPMLQQTLKIRIPYLSIGQLEADEGLIVNRDIS